VDEINVIAVISSRVGLEQLVQAHPDVSITIGTVDESISETGSVMPGLGDAGDRQFGTGPVGDDDESLLHPSKRKRSMDDTEDIVKEK
jgi:uracil phosphoribosyltransferase